MQIIKCSPCRSSILPAIIAIESTNLHKEGRVLSRTHHPSSFKLLVLSFDQSWCFTTAVIFSLLYNWPLKIRYLCRKVCAYTVILFSSNANGDHYGYLGLFWCTAPSWRRSAEFYFRYLILAISPSFPQLRADQFSRQRQLGLSQERVSITQ